jgi:plastocyanin
MTRIRLAIIAAIAGLALALPAAAATPSLVGTVGPGFTISLKKGGKKVTRLARGRYTLTVRDMSTIHNFRLRGPRVNRRVTAVEFVGNTTLTLTLRRGTYRFLCDPHPFDMRGSFTVS